MTLDRIIYLEKQFAERIHNIYQNAARFRWDAAFVNHACCEVWNDTTYRKLPRYAKSFVEGVRHQCDRLHWKLVVFSYVVRGKRLTIDSDAFRRVSPQYVNKHCMESGAFVYREDVSKLFTLPNGELANGK